VPRLDSLALPTNIRLVCKWLAMTINTLAYFTSYYGSRIHASKAGAHPSEDSFRAQRLDWPTNIRLGVNYGRKMFYRFSPRLENELFSRLATFEQGRVEG
jgi:hypothetical protein